MKCDSLLPRGTTPCPWCGELKAHRFPTVRLALASLAGVGFIIAVSSVLVQEGRISIGVADETQPAVGLIETEAPVVAVAMPESDLDVDPAALGESVPGEEIEASEGPPASFTAPAPMLPQRFTQRDPETQEEIRWVRTVAGNYANVRADGNSQAPILGMLSPGDALELEDTSRGWRRVRSGSTSGWVWAPILNLPTLP